MRTTVVLVLLAGCSHPSAPTIDADGSESSESTSSAEAQSSDSTFDPATTSSSSSTGGEDSSTADESTGDRGVCTHGGVVWYDTAPARHQAVAVDSDADGDLDVVISGYDFDGPVAFMLNAGDGSFAEPAPYAGMVADAVGAADFDANGHVDYAIVHDGTLALWMMQDDLTFAIAPTALTYPADIWNPTPADLDTDGDLDLVVSAVDPELGSGLQLLVNDGDGSLTARDDHFRTFLGTHALGDLDGDGALDLVTSIVGVAHELQVRLNDGGGGFPEVTAYGDFGISAAISIAIADFDDDGMHDLLLVTDDGYPRMPDELRLYRNSGDGTLAPPQSFGVEGELHMKATDLDNDGILDAVLYDVFAADTLFARGLGSGDFAPPEPLGYPGIFDVDAADFDGDGGLDLVLLDFSQERVGILLSECP